MKLVIALLLLLGIFPLPALSGCQITDYYVGFAGARLEQSVPLAVVADIGGIAASVTVFLVGNLNVFLRCECEPCCGTDEDQQAALTFRAAADILGAELCGQEPLRSTNAELGVQRGVRWNLLSHMKREQASQRWALRSLFPVLPMRQPDLLSHLAKFVSALGILRALGTTHPI